MRGIGAIALTFGALAIVVGCGPYEKAKLDREVDRLCAIDGGVRVYETVKLGKENFGADGEVFPQFRAQIRVGESLGPDYRLTSTKELIVRGDPSLTKWSVTITRVSDRKVLARQINYVRGGGDLPGPWAPSSYSCRNVSLDLSKLVFLKEDSK